MAGVFINFSNHPSAQWEEKQLEQAREWGEIVDLPFPQVDPAAGEDDVAELADQYLASIMEYQPSAVLCQGEFCLSYAVITGLKEQGVVVLAACSRRNTEEIGRIRKSEFIFERFRKYERASGGGKNAGEFKRERGSCTI